MRVQGRVKRGTFGKKGGRENIFRVGRGNKKEKILFWTAGQREKVMKRNGWDVYGRMGTGSLTPGLKKKSEKNSLGGGR